MLRTPTAPSPLVIGLYMWTFGTGLVDAISFVHFDHVFVANMTGNVVFIGLAAAGEGSIAIGTVAFAVLGFLLGAFACGRFLLGRVAHHRLVPVAVLAQLVLTGAALLVGVVEPSYVPLITGLLGTAMGTQNAVARHLKVPDATTTVVTMTVTGLAADRQQGAGAMLRRIVVVALLAAGAAAGALLLRTSLVAALAGVFLVNGAAALVALREQDRDTGRGGTLHGRGVPPSGSQSTT
ncbi:YoaK family protein [Streptomyces sp. NPDC102360]|uniref:YoaK family protein n=1 Tax=Streptomyces sp. NPDC102360 TaxID=3366160 RepID=UPI00381AF549